MRAPKLEPESRSPSPWLSSAEFEEMGLASLDTNSPVTLIHKRSNREAMRLELARAVAAKRAEDTAKLAKKAAAKAAAARRRERLAVAARTKLQVGSKAAARRRERLAAARRRERLAVAARKKLEVGSKVAAAKAAAARVRAQRPAAWQAAVRGGGIRRARAKEAAA